jgi:hypothetical protein
MRTKYARKPIKDACTGRHPVGGLCRGTLHPTTEPDTGLTVYACDSCDEWYTPEEAMTAQARRDERYERQAIVAEQSLASNAAKFTKTGDAEHDRVVDRRIEMNSQVTLNGLPLMIDAGQGGFEAAMKAVIMAVKASTPAPTNMKKE